MHGIKTVDPRNKLICRASRNWLGTPGSARRHASGNRPLGSELTGLPKSVSGLRRLVHEHAPAQAHTCTHVGMHTHACTRTHAYMCIHTHTVRCNVQKKKKLWDNTEVPEFGIYIF